jgi:hypothetical protein
MKNVYIYDFECAKWSHGDDMPTGRSLFTSCVSSSYGLVYVACRLNEHYNPLVVTKDYNVEEEKWEILPFMIQPHDQ